MINKNPNHDHNNTNNSLAFIMKNTFNLVYTKKPFLKQTFLEELTKVRLLPIIYLDFDLLYTEYARLDISFNGNRDISLYQIHSDNITDKLTNIIQQVSKKQCLVIVDSLNGLVNTFTQQEPNRIANSYLALLTTVAKQTNSIIVCACIARKKSYGINNNRLLLVSSNMYAIRLKNMNVVCLNENINEQGILKIITMNILDENLVFERKCDLSLSTND